MSDVQTALTSHTGRAVVRPDRPAEGRGVLCPDCEQDVAATKGGQPLPDDAPATRAFGWKCRPCENTIPCNAVGEDAPMHTDRMTAVTVTFRDAGEGFVPVPNTAVTEGGDQT